MYLGTQSEEILLYTREQWLSRGASQSAVRRRWLGLCTVWPSAEDWGCVLCDPRIQNDWTSRSASSPQCAYPFYSSHAGFYGKASHHPGLSVPLQRRFCSLRLLTFPKVKIAVERCGDLWMLRSHCTEAQSAASPCRLTSPTGECSRMRSKVSSDSLQTYIKVTPPVLEILQNGWILSGQPS